MRENRYNRKGLEQGNLFTIKFVREIYLHILLCDLSSLS